MHTVLCYGDSNTWGAIPGIGSGRFAPDVRWPGVMRARLGADFQVIENGLNGRTTTFDSLPRPWRNGRDLLVPAMETSYPLDLVVILLGTNDVSLPYLRVSDIVRGTGELVSIVRACDVFGPDGTTAPKVLVVGPHIVGSLSAELEPLHEGADARSRALAAALSEYLVSIECDFVDLSDVVRPSDADPWHWEADGHQAAGEAIATKVHQLLT